MAHKRWIFANSDKEKASLISEKFNIDPFISYLLVSRGVDNDLAVSDFLSKSYELSDPFNLKDMEKAVDRIEQAIYANEKITIYGDYDCDGVTSTALLVLFLREMGANVDYYIPSRLGEGYGMNKDSIKQIYESGTNLIITVDNGISALEESEYIYSLGMNLIITDHHQLLDTLPKAEAIINPHRLDNNIKFRDFAGVGVAFKLVCAIYGDSYDMLMRYSDLVAIGSLADVVPIVGENRSLVKAGIELINDNPKEGIKALLDVAFGDNKDVKSTDVIMGISPRINAAGRMEHAKKALEVLLSQNYDDAFIKAQELNSINANRQKIEASITDDVKLKLLDNEYIRNQRVIVVSEKDYHKGVIGIVASRILELYGKPTIILSCDDDGFASGSARSIDGFNMFEAISYCKDLLVKYGGHAGAAGLTVKTENIDAFRKKINEYALINHPVMPIETIKIDFKLSPFYLNLDLVDNLELLEPYGKCNEQAVFALMGVTVVSVTEMGNGKHIRIECDKKGRKIRIVKFNMTKEDFPFVAGDIIDCAVNVSKNFFKGKYYLSVKAEDIRLHGIDDDKYFEEKAIYELFKLNQNNDASVVPNRDLCLIAYKLIKQRKDIHMSVDDLYFKLKNALTYGQLHYAVKAFEECGLIEVVNNKIIYKEVNGKVDLMNAPVMKFLKGRISNG